MKIDTDALKCEMKVAKQNIFNSFQKINFDLKDLKKIVKYEIYPNVFKLLKLALTIPISSATCERSFSTMRRIKNWLRTSMEQDRFSNLSIININEVFQITYQLMIY